MGLEESEHIGRIVVDPRDSDVVYVAAQGPLWSAGGDRGLYKTIDGGETWSKVLEISERHRRQRGVDGSARSRRPLCVVLPAPPPHLDADQRWSRVGDLQVDRRRRDLDRSSTSGLPEEPTWARSVWPSRRSTRTSSTRSSSRIDDEGGFFRSTDGGENWDEARATTCRGSPQYYNEIVPDPHDVDRVYSIDTWLHVTENGGKIVRSSARDLPSTSTTTRCGSTRDDTDHLVAGCDGGVYETWDRGATWDFKANLPITQFYKIAVDNDLPFYNVYGGTQDNSTLGGPSRTTSDARHHQPRLVRHSSVATASSRGRSRESRHRLLPGAVRRPGALRPQERRERRHPAAARAGEDPLALELGFGARSSARTRRRGSTSPRSGSTAPTTAATAGRRSAPI